MVSSANRNKEYNNRNREKQWHQANSLGDITMYSTRLKYTIEKDF